MSLIPFALQLFVSHPCGASNLDLVFLAELVHRAAAYPSVMSEGEAKQAPAPTSTMETKSEAAATAAAGQGVSSVSPPVSTVTQAPPAPTTATEDEEEESEDESEILEESPCGRWQKRREEVLQRDCLFILFLNNL